MGLLQIYTGNGKGKTTAAIGQAVRAAGNGMTTFFAMFLKNFPYSELESLKSLSDLIEIKQYSNDKFLYRRHLPPAEVKIEVEKGFEECTNKMLCGNFDIIVLDEILLAILFDFISIDEFMKFLALRSHNIELILTGLYCPQEILQVADIVTDMKDVKQYYRKEVLFRKGLEC